MGSPDHFLVDSLLNAIKEIKKIRESNRYKYKQIYDNIIRKYNEIEKKLSIPRSPYLLPDAFAARVNTSIIYDHIDNKIFVTSDKKEFSGDFQSRNGVSRLILSLFNLLSML